MQTLLELFQCRGYELNGSIHKLNTFLLTQKKKEGSRCSFRYAAEKATGEAAP